MTMITNFDSTEQKHMWKRLAQDPEHPSHTPDITDMWDVGTSSCICERLLNTRTSIAAHFAGIARTAFMYCDRILLTDAQLFDGMFFLALGPQAVNGILAKSYKDGPTIVVSGRSATLEQCLKDFTLDSVANICKNAKGNILHQPCTHRHSQLSIRPLEYCFLDRAISAQESLSQPQQFYDALSDRFDQAEARGEHLSNIIADAFAQLFSSERNTGNVQHSHARFAFLAQRWQEWIDAEKQGLILYENQQDNAVKERTHSDGFATCFSGYADRYKHILLDHVFSLSTTQRHSQHEHDSDIVQEFTSALSKITSMPKRSDAWSHIANTGGLPENNDPASHVLGLSRQTMRDWYQFVYLHALAKHLGARLIAVDTPPSSFEQVAGKAQSGTGSTLMLAGCITQQLGSMPFTRFSTFCYEHRTVIRRWRECNHDTSPRQQRFRTRDMAYAVDQAAQEHGLRDDARRLAQSFSLAGLLALLTALTDNIWLNGSAPLWLIVLAASLIGIVPNIVDVAAWLRGVHSSSKTVVYLA